GVPRMLATHANSRRSQAAKNSLRTLPEDRSVPVQARAHMRPSQLRNPLPSRALTPEPARNASNEDAKEPTLQVSHGHPSNCRRAHRWLQERRVRLNDLAVMPALAAGRLAHVLSRRRD